MTLIPRGFEQSTEIPVLLCGPGSIVRPWFCYAALVLLCGAGSVVRRWFCCATLMAFGEPVAMADLFGAKLSESPVGHQAIPDLAAGSNPSPWHL